MTIVYISFGSNKGDRSKNIAKALDLVRKHFDIIDISNFYLSDPVYTNQSRQFLNGVVKVETNMTAKEVYEKLDIIEKQAGRINIARDEDKPIDLDLLYFGNKVIQQAPMVVPHHKIHQRKYILTAMNDIATDFVHPAFNKTQKELLNELECNKKVKSISD